MFVLDSTLDGLLRELPAEALGEVLAFHRKEISRLIAIRRRSGVRSLFSYHETDPLRGYHMRLVEAILADAARRDRLATEHERRVLSVEAGS